MDAEKVCFTEKMESSRLFQKTHCWLFSEAAQSTASTMNVPLRINMLRRQWRRWRPWRRRRWRRQRGRRHNHRDESRHFYANAVKTIAVTNWLFVVKRQNGLSPVSWARLNLDTRFKTSVTHHPEVDPLPQMSLEPTNLRFLNYNLQQGNLGLMRKNIKCLALCQNNNKLSSLRSRRSENSKSYYATFQSPLETQSRGSIRKGEIRERER